MAESYVSVPRFTELSRIKPWKIVELEKKHPGFLLGHLEAYSRQIEDRLRCKYVIPFPSRHTTIETWIVALVNREAQLEIGIEPNDLLWDAIDKKADLAEKQIDEAADTQSSRWNLPTIDAQDKSGIVKGGPFGYSEGDPFTWTDRQVENSHGRQ